MLVLIGHDRSRHPVPVTTSLTDLLLEILPPDRSTLGNLSARKALSGEIGREIGKEEYEAIRDKGVDLGLIFLN